MPTEKSPQGSSKPNHEVLALPVEADIATSSIDDVVTLAENRLESHRRILGVALRITNNADWVDMQGKPYLTGSGAEKIASLFGVQIPKADAHGNSLITCEKEWGEDEEGKYYFYTVMGVGRLKDHEITAMGTCSSRDQFFAKVHGKLRPMSEIDETNVKKAAYTNFMVNVITRLLGIRNLTWEQVRSGGISQEESAKVEYNKSADSRKITEKQVTRLMAIATKAKVTEGMIKTQFKLKSLKDITRSQYDEICTWAETARITAPKEPVTEENISPSFLEDLNEYIAILGVTRIKNAMKEITGETDPVKIKSEDDRRAVVELLRSWVDGESEQT